MKWKHFNYVLVFSVSNLILLRYFLHKIIDIWFFCLSKNFENQLKDILLPSYFLECPSLHQIEFWSYYTTF